MYRIPDEWHSEYSYNCLTYEQFKQLQEEYEIDDQFPTSCDSCGTYTIHKYNRCDCDNRRCYFQVDEEGEFFVEVD